MTGLTHHRDNALRSRGQRLAAEREWARAPEPVRLPVHRTSRRRNRPWPARTLLAIYAALTLANIAHAAGWL